MFYLFFRDAYASLIGQKILLRSESLYFIRFRYSTNRAVILNARKIIEKYCARQLISFCSSNQKLIAF